MDSIFRGSLATSGGRALAWVDSLLVDHALLRLVWSNAAVVIPGRLARSNHPTPGRLSRAARLGLRSVINLRGATANGSDALSRRQAARLGLVLLDVPLSSGHPPPRDRLLALIAALQTAPTPALVHCKSGADRAGFAAAVALVLHGAAVAEARRQLTWRHGHLARSRAGVLDAVLLCYQREGEGRQSFPDWVRDGYDPDAIARAFGASGLAGVLHDRVLGRE